MPAPHQSIFTGVLRVRGLPQESLNDVYYYDKKQQLVYLQS